MKRLRLGDVRREQKVIEDVFLGTLVEGAAKEHEIGHPVAHCGSGGGGRRYKNEIRADLLANEALQDGGVLCVGLDSQNQAHLGMGLVSVIG